MDIKYIVDGLILVEPDILMANVFVHARPSPQKRNHLRNIAKGTTDPGVDYFNQLVWFGLVNLVL